MSDARKLAEEIMAEINTSNRGSCDYFIVDQIEKICLRTLEKEKENDELEI